MKLTAPARGDMIAGISVALVLIPQSLAYAELAGLPAVHGLYAAAAAPIAAAAIGSSPYLQTGPVALTSLLTLGAIAPLTPTGTAEFAGLAALLALLVGVARVALGLLRWGALSYLMSVPVVTGFTVAAAVLILASQVPALVSSDVPSGGNPLATAGRAVADPGDQSMMAIGIGALTVLIVLAGRRLLAVFPWFLLITVLGLAIVHFDVVDVGVVGEIPNGFPALSLALPWSATAHLLIPALVIAVVGFAEPASIARKYATIERRPWDPDKEFIGQGLANLGAAVVGGYPAGGSFSRSALNRQSGGRTRWSGAITGLVVVGFLPFADILSDLPSAVLAGLIIVAAVSLIDVSAFREYWQHSRPQFLVAVPTFAATLLLAPHVERGLIIGVGVALGVHLWRETRLDVDAWRVERTLYVLPHGVLYFGSAPAFEAAISGLLAENPDVDVVEIDLHRLGRVDLTGTYALRDIVANAREGGTTVHLTRIPSHAAERLQAVLGPPSAPSPP